MLEDLALPEKKQSCKIRTLAEGMNETDRKIFLQAVENPEWFAHTLSTELKKRGVTVSDKTIRLHRSKGCSC
jgi:hypothetical protein